MCSLDSNQSITLSIVIPARNEEKYLPRCLNALERSANAADISLEVVVVINRTTDRTEEIARSRGCIVVHEDAKNLSQIRNTGVRASTHHVVITVDADSCVSKGLLGKIVSKMRDPHCVGGGVVILPDRYSLGILCTGFFLGLIALFYGIQCGLFFFRRDVFEQIGGFDEELLSAEDIDFARRLKSHAKEHRKQYSPIYFSCIYTSCRKFDAFGDWYFLRHPFEALSLLRGKNSRAANKIWYDFDHR